MDVVPDDENITIDEELQKHQFGKVYIMLGVNELGTGTAETYYQQFKKVVERIRELQPDALIFVESIIHVSALKDAEGTVINNKEINARNKWLKKLADNKTIFYLDYNEVLDDENGALKADSTFDGVHLQADQLEPSFMQGLCSFGFSCRLAIQALIPGEPERMTRMAAQMSSVLFPDTPVRLQLWKIDDHKAFFRFMNLTNNKPVLNRGVFEWK